MNKEPQTRLNICVLPPQTVSKEIITLTSQLRRDGQAFHVDGRTRFPHLTSFMGVFPDEAIERVIKRIEGLPKARPLEFNAYGLTISSNGYVEIGYNRTPDLERLQASIAAAVAGFRAPAHGIADPGMSKAEVLNSNAYGYKLFGDEYRPHITLGSYREGHDIAIPWVKSFFHLDFVADEICVARSDHFGSVVEVLARVPLV